MASPSDNVFDTSKCGLPPIARIPCGTILRNPHISPVPPDISDCPHIPIVPPPPLPPCPLLQMPQSASLHYGGDATTNPPHLAFTIKKTDCCTYDFKYDLHIPCPTLKPLTQQSVDMTKVASPAVPALRWYFTQGNDCSFDLIIEGDYLCPAMEPVAVVQKPVNFATGQSAKLSYFFTEGVDCTQTLDIDLTVPCPQFATNTKSNVTTLAQGHSASVTVEIAQSNCTDLGFTFNFGIPKGATGPQGPQGPQGPPGTLDLFSLPTYNSSIVQILGHDDLGNLVWFNVATC